MHTFRTELHIEQNPDKIEYGSRITSIGSGFSNILVEHFRKYGFEVSSNPYGNIYNPISIFDSISRTLKNESPIEEHISETEGRWSHFDFHSKVQGDSKNDLTRQLAELTEKTNQTLHKTDFLFITLGSAYAYKHTATNKIVANCQRAPRNQFHKTLLTSEQIVQGFRRIYKSLNHVKNIILIVSPIMHTGDSITLNAVSKSILRLACHQILSEFPYVKYFPAYEFLLSDLRDYRFYDKDMIHPTEQAMDYIFDKFVEAYVAPESKKLILEIEEIIEAVQSTPYRPQSDTFKNEIKEALQKIDLLDSQMNLSVLKQDLESMIAN